MYSKLLSNYKENVISDFNRYFQKFEADRVYGNTPKHLFTDCSDMKMITVDANTVHVTK